jgi:hypothetical protein
VNWQHIAAYEQEGNMVFEEKANMFQCPPFLLLAYFTTKSEFANLECV